MRDRILSFSDSIFFLVFPVYARTVDVRSVVEMFIGVFFDLYCA